MTAILATSTATTNGLHPGANDQGAIPGLSQTHLAAFSALIDLETGQIGRVVGSEKEPAGSHRFYIWAKNGEKALDVGHIVVAFSEEAAVIGVVDEPRRFSDLRSFLDDYFDRQLEEVIEETVPTQRPEILVFAVNVLRTKHFRDDVTSHRPPESGPVFYATKRAIEFALGLDEFSGIPVPALMHTNGNVEREPDGTPRLNANGDVVFQRAAIQVDSEYLVGPEAGHANWTGQSGLATKTSHALFLTSAIFQKLRSHPERPETVAALMFNVKGPDLLWLDKPADPDLELKDAYQEHGAKGLREEDHAAYAALGLKVEPFSDFRIFAPFKPAHVPHAQGQHAVRLESAKSAASLNTYRNAPTEASGVVFPVLWELETLLRTPHRIFEYGDLDDKLFGFVSEVQKRQIGSLDQLKTLFAEIDAYFEESPEKPDWQGHHKFTIMKARNRFQGLTGKFGGLLSEHLVDYGRLPKVDDVFRDGELRVVDIAGCNSNVQELLVSTVINKIWRMAEEEKLGVNKLIVFVDELNKYAPGGGEGALRDTLVDIAARGRHLNVVLFGAQQFRSKVESEVLGNCGTSLYGRVGDEEITNAAYRSLSETTKAELLGLPKGRLLIRHAHFRTPVFGTFPMPPTIAGMAGQRVFNGENGVASVHPSVGLWKIVLRYDGPKAPSKAEVREAADGLDRATLESICTKVEDAARTNAARGKPGASAWWVAKDMMQRERKRSI